MFEFGFLDRPFLFPSFLSGLFQFSSKRQAICDLGRDVVWIFVSLSPRHIYPFGGVSLNSVSLVKCPRIWQTSVSVDFPIVINSFFLRNVQICMSRPVDNNVLQWNWEWFFFRHIWLNPRFHPSRHYEIRLSLTQLCDVNQSVTAATRLGSVCAALIRRR